MPRIRKKTSNRQSTNDRRKIQKKVRESKKKRTKASKKETNVQWKSKHKKDPGIPNNFPYKDEILKEVAEQRRQAAELKQRRKEEKKALRGQDMDDQVSDVEAQVDVHSAEDYKLSPEDVAQGIADITARSFPASKAKARQLPVDAESDTDEEPPVLVNRDLTNLSSVLDNTDIILYLLDARDPTVSRSTILEQEVVRRGKQMILLLTKIDLCPREAINAWTTQLRAEYPTLLFRSASSQLPGATESPSKLSKSSRDEGTRSSSNDSWGAADVLSLLESTMPSNNEEEVLRVAVVGLTNVGKSSFINSIAGGCSLPIYSISSCTRGSTTTTLPQEVVVDTPSGRKIKFIDTPGLSWDNSNSETSKPEENDADTTRAKDILARNRGRIDKLKDPKDAASQIIQRCSYEDLMLFYNLPAFIKGNVDSFLTGLARSHRLVKKHGEVDLAGACRILLRDWNTDKFPRYTLPPSTIEQVSSPPLSPSTSTITSSTLDKVYSTNQQILQKSVPRKEKMTGGGVVKLITVPAEIRNVNLQDPWVDIEDEDSNSDIDQDVAENHSSEDGDEDEDEEDGQAMSDEEEVEREQMTSHRSRNKKRKADTAMGPMKPSKKVSFATSATQPSSGAKMLKGSKAVPAVASTQQIMNPIPRQRGPRGTGQLKRKS